MNLSRTSPSLNDAPGLLYAGFNQDYGCFAVGLDNGFRVYNCEPLIEQARDESDEGGIALVEMLYRTNYLALVGGGRNPRYPPNKVIIYDSVKGKPVLELEYKSEVKNVKLRRDRLTVVLQNKVFVYHFALPPQLLHTFETCDNEKGLAAVSTSLNHAILIIPGRQKGHLQIIDLNSLGYYISVGEADPFIIAAHSGKLSCLSLNQDGSRCATTSDKGTLIRVFNTATGTLLHELRRGMDRAEIYSIAFNTESTRICVSSDKGTIHIFNLDPSVVTHDLLPKYFSSEWSFANAKIATESRCLVAFGNQKNSFTAICADGSCYKFYFDPRKGGECTRESFVRFLKRE
ncbi:hypothetical protein HMPREF1544_08634 [Mucor circinelloides 1006PhL]|uniref:WD repeat domain phosphoinositide-interacting protein 3 n=1 Tax=Mucor circinelloides f. circinelloides (strain 1006PhL) TaxID=1220926 RepID=S2J889_MUCC1|nr:hypothetical protein HMPREF1544_08634 [Mucor circinelloides 1006PhL]